MNILCVGNSFAVDAATYVHRVLAVSCYDEEPTGYKNNIFCAIKGFDEYVTIRVENNFSVYKMRKFNIELNEDSFELIPIKEDIETNIEE